MWMHNVKIGLRTLWKNKGYTAVNIGGLTIALCCFIFILLYANYEHSYDRWDQQLARIYRVDTKVQQINSLLPSAPPTLPVLLQQLPEIQATTQVTSWYTHQDKLLEWNGSRFYTDGWIAIDSNFFNLFPYPFVYGNAQRAFDVPNYAILSEKFARAHFPHTNPVGQHFSVNNKASFVITGVVRDPPTPTQIHFNILLSDRKQYLDSLTGTSATRYLLAQHALDTATFNHKLTSLYRKSAQNDSTLWWGGANDLSLVVEPLQNLHLHSLLSNNNGSGTTDMFLTLGFLILLLAAINYTNLSIAQAAKRAGEIAIRKVLGASRKQIALLFLLETTALVVFSFLLALLLVKILLPAVNHLLHLDLRLWNPYFLRLLMGQSGLIVLAIILLAGMYPALILSGFAPIKYLKGGTLPKVSGGSIRKILLFIQLAVFLSFMSATLIIYAQTTYLAQRDFGLHMDGIIVLKNQQAHSGAQLLSIERRIGQLPGVQLVSHASSTLGAVAYSFQIAHKGQKQLLRFNSVGYHYFQLMGIPIRSGRVFSPERDHDSSRHIILNQQAAKVLGIAAPGANDIKLGDHDQTTIGIVANTLNTNPKDSIQGEAYRLQTTGKAFKGDILVKLSADHFNDAITDIKQLWNSFEPGLPLRYSFMTQAFADYLDRFYRLNLLIALFSAISLFIGLMGLLALALYQIRQRTKEISIRRVLGASVLDIFKTINRSFFIITLLANLLSIPLIYILMQHWLDDFAYRIRIPFLPFLVTFLLSLLLTSLAVGTQLWKTTKENPATVLKNE